MSEILRDEEFHKIITKLDYDNEYYPEDNDLIILRKCAIVLYQLILDDYYQIYWLKSKYFVKEKIKKEG